MFLTSISRPNSTVIDTRPKLYVLEQPRRVAFRDCDSAMQNIDDESDDNPFRPGSELSREADIIVNLIKEGKPITPTREMVNNRIVPVTATNGNNSKISEQAKKNGATPGVIEVNHSIVHSHTEASMQEPNKDVEMVIINKKKKKCCQIQ